MVLEMSHISDLFHALHFIGKETETERGRATGKGK
jgi:hypothetical protein